MSATHGRFVRYELMTADIGAAQAQRLGGAIRHEPTDIPTVGRFAVIADPAGAVFALAGKRN